MKIYARSMYASQDDLEMEMRRDLAQARTLILAAMMHLEGMRGTEWPPWAIESWLKDARKFTDD